MRTSLALFSALGVLGVLGLAACGDNNTPPGRPDSRVGSDGPPVVFDAAPLTCAAYCSSIMANCTAANAQYGGMPECLASCATWMPGTSGQTSGNTLGCRQYHAGAAASSPDVHCRHAGPGGDGMCGTNCEGFCTLVLGVCTGANASYTGATQCANRCATYATTPPYSASVMTGNSLACRLYHGTAASTDPNTHCPHTALASATCQ